MDEWVYKYRPKTLDDLIIKKETRDLFKSYLDKETFLNCTLYGKQGIGKTSVAEIVINTIPDCTYLFVNASDEGGINTIRDKVTEFTQFVGYSKTKVVVLDEVNGLSNKAQDALRTLIHTSIDDTRFILTTNYISKLIDPIQSRCIPINITPPPKDIFKRLLYILKEENIKYTKEDLEVGLKEIVKENYPDIRAMIKNLEICCQIDNMFIYRKYNKKESITELIAFIKKNMSGQVKCRKQWLEKQTEFDNDYQILAGEMYNSYSKNPEKMHIIAQYLRDMPNVLDQEIQFNDMIYTLNQLNE